jgi:hypothetical protein
MLDPGKLRDDNERLRAYLRHILALVGERDHSMGERMKQIGYDARTALGRDDSIAKQVGTDRNGRRVG